MKLYYVPGACSRVPHITLNEIGIKFEAEKLDPKNKKVSEGDYLQMVNPKGQVPALRMDNGEVLTETAVITQYIADLKPELKLIPAFGTLERYRLMEWMNYIATELQKGFSPLWNPKTPDDIRAQTLASVEKKFDFISTHLTKNKYLLGNNYSVADIYLYVVMGWTKNFKLDISKWPKIISLIETVGQRPAVQKTLQTEQPQ